MEILQKQLPALIQMPYLNRIAVAASVLLSISITWHKNSLYLHHCEAMITIGSGFQFSGKGGGGGGGNLTPKKKSKFICARCNLRKIRKITL